MDWIAIHQGHEYTSSGLFLILSSIALLITVGATLYQARRRREWEVSAPRGWFVLWNIFITVVLASAFILLVTTMLAGAVNSSLDALLHRNRVSIVTLFGSLIGAELIVAFLGMICVITTFLLLMNRRPPRRGRFGAALLLVVLAGSWLMTQAGAQHALMLTDFQPLPQFENHEVPWIHEGQQVELHSKINVSAHRWRIDPIPPIEGSKVGEVELVEGATTPWLRMKKVSSIAVKAESGSPAFPLRVGNRWIYSKVTQEDTAQLLFFRNKKQHIEREAWVLEITKSALSKGVRKVLGREPSPR